MTAVGPADAAGGFLTQFPVMAGPGPAIRFLGAGKGVDSRAEPEDDGGGPRG